MYIKSGLPWKELKSHKSPEDLEEIFLELVLGSKKWILIGGYNPRTENEFSLVGTIPGLKIYLIS